MRITVLGKSPSWQDADGACSGYLIEEDGVHRPARLRQRRVLEAAPLRRLRRRRRGRHLAPARRPLPRPRAVLLRAHLRAAPAAGAGRRAGPAPTTRRARALHAPPGARETVPPRRRRVGQRGPDRERVRPARVRPGRRRSSVGPLRIRFQRGAALHRPRTRSRSPRANGGGRITYGADARPTERARRLRARHRPADDRGDAAAARARRARAATSPRRGRRARAGGPARGASCSPTSPTSSTSDWARDGGRARRSAAPVELAREGAVYDV